MQVNRTQPLLFNSKQNRCFSNFHPCVVRLGGYSWLNNEAAYQCIKHENWRFLVDQWQVAGWKAKEMSKTIDVRPDWEQIKVQVMTMLIEAKFKNPVMRYELLETGDQELIHYAPWDEFWGTGRKNLGRNMLGELLMAHRAYLMPICRG